MWKFLCQRTHYFREEYLFIFSISSIDRKYNHRLLHFFRLADHEMSPEPDSRLRIIGGNTRITGQCVNLTEYRIDLVIREDTISTVLDAVELSWKVKSESILIVHSLTIRYILPPRELDLVAVVLALGRRDDGMELCIFCKVLEAVECLTDLLFLDMELLFIRDREPFAATIELPLGWDRLFEWRFFYCAKYLRLEMILLGLGDSQIDHRVRDSSARDDDPTTIGCGRKSRTPEDELFYRDIFEYFVFFDHKKIRIKYADYREKVGKGKVILDDDLLQPEFSETSVDISISLVNYEQHYLNLSVTLVLRQIFHFL